MLADLLPYAIPFVALIVAAAAYGLNRREGGVKATERHEAAGPQVEPVRGKVSGQTVKVRLRLVGGPPEFDVTVRCGASWCSGISGHQTPAGEGSTVTQPGTHPSQSIDFYAHLTVEPRRDPDQVLPVVVDIEASDDRPSRWWRRNRPRRWTRHVSVPITFPPMIY